MSAAHPKKERTLIIVKPDGIQRSLMGEILMRIERTGLKFVAVKFLLPEADQCWTHDNKYEESLGLTQCNKIGKLFHDSCYNYN